MRWFRKPPKTGLEHRLQLLQQWLGTGTGNYLWRSERNHIEHELHFIFGYHACQMTIDPQAGLLDNCQISRRFLLNPVKSAEPDKAGLSSMTVDPYNWPVCPGSLDLVLLHHVLEFSERPHRLLSEAANTIIPGGKLMIVGFNPWSLASLSRWVLPSHRKALRGTHFLSPVRMRDWLTLLGFNVERIHHGAYLFPLDRLFKGVSGELLEQRCKHWLLPLGGYYVMLATREVHGITPVKRSWPDVGRRLVPNPIVRPSAGRIGDHS